MLAVSSSGEATRSCGFATRRDRQHVIGLLRERLSFARQNNVKLQVNKRATAGDYYVGVKEFNLPVNDLRSPACCVYNACRFMDFQLLKNVYYRTASVFAYSPANTRTMHCDVT